ncbi:MAG: glycosyltransferase family 1 protein [Patescibacteria group bacterium]
MKIGVNARLLTRPFTGIGQYTKNLFKELAKLDLSNQYILVVPEQVESKIAAQFSKNVEIKILPEKKLPSAGMRKTWWEQIQLPKFFKEKKVDLAFYTYPSNPWAQDWYKNGIKTVVTVHDCIPWMNKHYRPGVLSKMYHAQGKKAVAKADLVLTVSGESMKDIVEVCRVDKKKIEVLYNDADDVYKEIPHERSVKEALERFSLKKDKFFLYVGGYDERKNVAYLLREFEKFHEDFRDIPLVLAGGKLFKNKLYASLDENDLGNVVRTGFLSETELAILYRNCTAFINLSKHEGFNIPILEAANCGAPIILSDIAVHREVAENAAIFVDIKKEGMAFEAMKKMVSHEVREKFSKNSEELAKKYSWKKYAKILKDMLLSLANQKTNGNK